MLTDRRLVSKNVKGCRLQAGVIFGSNPRSATKWCDQPTAPPRVGTKVNFVSIGRTGTNYGVPQQSAPFAGSKSTDPSGSCSKSWS